MPFYVPGKTFSAHVVTYLEKKASQGSKCYKVQSSETFQVWELKLVTSFRIGNNSMSLVSTVKASVVLIVVGIDVIVGVYLVIFS
jgi:hypothetical protein